MFKTNQLASFAAAFKVITVLFISSISNVTYFVQFLLVLHSGLRWNTTSCYVALLHPQFPGSITHVEVEQSL